MKTLKNYPMDYYDIDAILADEEKLKVKFNYKIDCFGMFGGQSSQIINPGKAIELPFFLISFLLINEHCELVNSPLEQLKDDLDAHSPIVDLNNSHFYHTSKNPENYKYLGNIFYERIGDFIKYLNKEDFSEEDISKLSYVERKYLIGSRKMYKMFQDFYLRKSD